MGIPQARVARPYCNCSVERTSWEQNARTRLCAGGDLAASPTTPSDPELGAQELQNYSSFPQDKSNKKYQLIVGVPKAYTKPVIFPSEFC